MRNNRTLLAIGRAAYQKIQDVNILVFGADPVGAEIIKSFLLFGASRITIFDDSLVDEGDSKSNMFITAKSVGLKRGDAIESSLKRLNPSSSITILGEKPDFGAILKYSLVVITYHLNYDEICSYNEVCRKNNIGFVLADSYSFSGFVFIDFGDSFYVENENGEPPEKYRIQAISNSNPGHIRFVGKVMPKLPRDSKIYFQGLTSMTELNEIGIVNLHCEGLTASIECDTTNFSPFDASHPNGFAIQAKEKLKREFKSYANSIDSPFHSSFFDDRHKTVRDFFIQRQKSLNSQNFYLSSTSTIIAGIAVNECLKFVTKNLNPMKHQWFLFNNDILFDPVKNVTNNDVIEKLHKLNVAIVGVGATGCEAAKIFALSGINKLALIDADSIETTNLNRQVLFSDEDIGKNKAEAAANHINKLLQENGNQTTKVEFYPHFIDNETLTMFSDSWFKQFDSVWSMVDSYTARGYIEGRCAPLKISNFTGGISKRAADWHTHVPFYSSRYSDPITSADNGTPSCTLKLFPYKPEHCIEWAHHQLNRILQKTTNLNNLEGLIEYASTFFLTKFVNKIKDLQHFHPLDETVNGVRYWSNHRIFPNPIQFEENNKMCTQFIKSICFLIAEKNNISITDSNFDFLSIAQKINNSIWKPPDESVRTTFDDTDGPSNILDEDLFLHDNEIHIDFIEAAANLRSKNYGLGDIDRLLCQSHAGKIETAVSTTASICSASLFIEFLVSLVSPDELCRGKYVSSPFSYITYREPIISKIRFGLKDDVFFSPWDFLHYNCDLTFSEVQKDIENNSNGRIFTWATDNGTILPTISEDGRINFARNISVNETFKNTFPSQHSSLLIEASLEFEGDYQPRIPPIIIQFPDS